MNKIILGTILGGILGVFDGLSALISAPETASLIMGFVIGSTIKGIAAGFLIGYFAKRVDSTPKGIAFGSFVGLLLALPIAMLNASAGRSYYWQIMLPGAVLGVLVGFATQRYGSRPPTVRQVSGTS